MVREAGSSWDWKRISRLAGLAIVITGVVLGLVLAQPLLETDASRLRVWQAKLAFFIGLEIAYGVVLVATLVVTPVLGVLFARARRRRMERPWIARWLLLSSSLLCSLVAAEGGAALRRAGVYGQPTTAMAGPPREEGHGEPPTFPAPPAEVVLKTSFPDPPDDAVNLVVLGESSAAGVPYNLFGLSVGSLVVRELERAIPGRRFHLTTLATTGDTLELQHRKLAELERPPDILIVYCGHNEFSARMAWAREVEHYDDGRPPSRRERFVALVDRTSPLCGWIREAADTCRIAIPPPSGGYRTLVDVPAYTEAEYAALLTDFRARLEQIVAYAERLGALPILIAPPANDTGFEPNRSFLASRTRHADREAFERDFRAARRREDTDPDPSRSIDAYRSLLAREPGFAEAHYRLARLLEGTGAWDEAYRHDVTARDADGLPMRCPTPFQEAYRAVAARHRCIFIDGQAYFHAIGRHGLLDDHLFVDAMHPSLRGQIALAQVVLQGLRASRALGWPETTPAPILDPARCAQEYGLGPRAWEWLCGWGAQVHELLAPAHYDPARRLAARDAYLAAFDWISKGVAPEAAGLPNLGIPAAVPAVPGAAAVEEPATAGAFGRN